MNVNQSKWPQHLYALDFSRGIAALSVVLWHWQHFAYTQNNELALFQRETQPFYGLFRIFYEAGAMGVQYFFVLSGFIFFWLYASSINTQLISGFKFAIQRFSRLYPLQLLFAIAVSCGILEQSFYLSSMYLIVFFLILILISYLTFHRFERPAQSFLRKKLLYNSKQ